MRILLEETKMPEQKYKVPSVVKNNAKLGLKKRAEASPSNKGGTEVGVGRARQLIEQEYVDLSTIKQMYSFFSRHAVDKTSRAWKDAEAKGEWSKGKIAHYLWGGDSGYAWAKKIADANR